MPKINFKLQDYASDSHAIDLSQAVSIVIPVFNGKKYVWRCLQSVHEQTYKNIIIIIVDDGSTDGSYELCETFCRQDRRATLVKNNLSKGVVGARATGLMLAQSQYITFLDVDDWIDLNHIELLVNGMDDKSSFIQLCCSGISYDTDDAVIKHKSVRATSVFTPEQALLSIHAQKAVYPVLWNKLFVTEIARKVEQPFGVTVGEDYTFVARYLMKLSGEVKQLVPATHHYYQRLDSVCRQGYSEKYIKVVRNYSVVRDELCEHFPSRIYDIDEYYVVQLMGSVTAMTRNGRYNQDLIDFAQDQARRYFIPSMRSKVPSLFEKCAIALLVLSSHLFIIVAKLLMKQPRN